MINIIGLGKMGYNLYRNLLDNNIEVKAYDYCEKQRERCIKQENIVSSLDKLIRKEPSIYWMMLPSGDITESVLKDLLTKVEKESIIIDAGNSHYEDSRRRYSLCQDYGVEYLDIGVSGGMEGALNGACMMVGGNEVIFKKIEPVLKQICVENGYMYAGLTGSGHYLKMIHNGIEYGMMQSISEGFNILKKSDIYDFDLAKVANLFNHGSVIRSWLMELSYEAFRKNPNMADIAGIIPSSGEGKWTIEEALRLEVPSPIISQSLQVRYASQDDEKFSEKVCASLRNEFGGHKIHKE